MKPIRTQQRYRCDFCKKTGIKSSIARHEKSCFRNPNRICYMCEGTGKVSAGDEHDTQVPCPNCERFDRDKLKQIEEYEKNKII